MAVNPLSIAAKTAVRGRPFEKGRSSNLAARVVRGTGEAVHRGALDGEADALPARSLKPTNSHPASRALIIVPNKLIYIIFLSIIRSIFGVASIFLPDFPLRQGNAEARRGAQNHAHLLCHRPHPQAMAVTTEDKAAGVAVKSLARQRPVRAPLITETLEIVPRQWKVIQTVREKFTCRSCEKITQPPAPFHAIARARAGASLRAMILYAKFGQHQPLHRQSDIYPHEGIELKVSTLADWVGACSATLAPTDRPA
jgi:hypothetical protein